MTYSVVPGIDRASEDDEGTVAKMRRDLVDHPLEDRHGWAEELVHRRPDHDDQGLGAFDDRAVRPELEAPGGEDLPKQLVGAGLEERHVAGGDPVQRGLARVVDADTQAGIGQRRG